MSFVYRSCDGCGNVQAHMKNGRVHTRHLCTSTQEPTGRNPDWMCPPCSFATYGRKKPCPKCGGGMVPFAEWNTDPSGVREKSYRAFVAALGKQEAT